MAFNTCDGCKYFSQCGDSTRVEPCLGLELELAIDWDDEDEEDFEDEWL